MNLKNNKNKIQLNHNPYSLLMNNYQPDPPTTVIKTKNC